MLHTKRIGRIALALSIAIFSGVTLAANAAPETSNTPRVNLPGTRSFNPAITGHVATEPAADPVVLENVTQSPLNTSTNADTVRTLNMLRKQAEMNGTTRILVGLRIAFAPEGELTAGAVAQQRNEIVRMQSAVLEKVPSLKQRPEQIKQFTSSPFMALEVSADELKVLAGLTEIASIEEDRIASPGLGIEVVRPESK